MTKEFKIDGMSCMHCVKAIEMELKDLRIENYKVEIGNAIIDFDEDKVSESEIEDAIVEAGFQLRK